MAEEARCTPLHPENMGATCSDVRELLAPTSFHVVHGGCASPLNVDRAFIGQLSPLAPKTTRPSIGPVNKVCDGIDDCVRARSCREPVRKKHAEYDIYQHIPAGYEQRTTYTDILLHDRRA